MTRATATDAIVLRLVDHGERHRIATLFTLDHGRLAALARNARGASRRFGGHLDLFNRGEALLETGRGLAALAGFDARHVYGSLREDVVKFAIACFFAELVLVTTTEGGASPAEFALLAGALAALDASPEPARRDLVLGFQLRWFHALGVLPPLDDADLERAGLPVLEDQPLAIARALLAEVPIPDLDTARFHAIGALTRAVRERVATRPLASTRFLLQVLEP